VNGRRKITERDGCVQVAPPRIDRLLANTLKSLSLSADMLFATRVRLAFAALLVAGPPLSSQVLDLTVHDVGIAIGDKPQMTGLRINFRDRNLREVSGVNVTLWSPYEPASGTVTGLALGIPATGARVINGVAAGILGVGAERRITGIGLGGLGVGGGGELRGIMIGGIGVGSGGGLTGLSIGGIGVGSGGPMRGVQVGLIGVGSGASLTGISIGGIGVGGAGDIKGLAIGGIGVGGGGSLTGIGIGGVGVGTATGATGLMIGLIGVGSGGTLNGISIGGIGVGAPTIKGLVLSAVGAGAQNLHAVVIAPGYVKVEKNGRFDGGSLSAVNNVRGELHGLTIGLFNYAHELHGAQVGLLNISDNGGNRRVLPLISVR
jgi:hypothetical protein